MANIITIPIGAIIHEIDIDVHDKTSLPSIYAKQYDAGSRYIKATIWNNGIAYPILSSDTIYFAGTKTGDNGILASTNDENDYQFGIDSSGNIIYQIHPTDTATLSSYEAEFRILDSNNNLKSTPKIKMFIEKSALQDSTPIVIDSGSAMLSISDAITNTAKARQDYLDATTENTDIAIINLRQDIIYADDEIEESPVVPIDAGLLDGQSPSYYATAAQVGNLSSLQTTSKANMVGAVNEVNANKITKGSIYVNVKDYGAIGDYNGTTGTDNLTFFNLALAALSTNGGTILVPDGDYWFSNAWTISQNNITVCISPNATLRTTTQTSDGELLVFRGAGTGTEPTIKNGRVIGGGTIITPAALDNCIGFVRCDGCYVDDVIVSAGNKGVTAQQYNNNIVFNNIRVLTAAIGVSIETGAENVSISKIRIDTCGKGISFSSENTAHVVNVVIDDVKIKQGTSDGIVLSLVDDVVVNHCIIKNVSGRGITCDNSSNVIIKACKLENVTQHGINMAIISDAFILDDIIIDGVSTASTNTYSGFNLATVVIPFSIKNCVLLGTTHKYAIAVASSSGNTGVSIGNNFTKGQSDVDYVYNGWKLKYINDIFGGLQFRLENGVRTIYGTAAPTTGTWAVGDRCINTVPAVGQPKSWICTVAGTAGTWVSEGNL